MIHAHCIACDCEVEVPGPVPAALTVCPRCGRRYSLKLGPPQKLIVALHRGESERPGGRREALSHHRGRPVKLGLAWVLMALGIVMLAWVLWGNSPIDHSGYSGADPERQLLLD